MQPHQPVETFAAKRLLTPAGWSSDDFFLADYTMNLYRGCNHGCIYCDTRSECYQIDRFDVVRHKENCLAMLEGELRQKKKPGTVFLGAASDPYNALEETLCITRKSLELLRKYSFGVGLTTKGSLAARDADVLADIRRAAPAYVNFSITAAEDELSLLIEPGAPPSSQRFAAMQALSGAGVLTGIWLNPVLPFMTDSEENIIALLRQTKESGGIYAICHFGMTLRTGNREYFFAALDRTPRFHGVRQKYADAFGLDYMCPSPHAQRLQAVFNEACDSFGLLHTFPLIAHAAREGTPTQMTLW